jgi:dCMP deaminase
MMTEQKLTKWDKRFIELAKFVSRWSKDSAKVGAVIAKNKGAIALGFNGFPTGIKDDKKSLNDKAKKNDITIHAEQNAVLVAGDKAEGATLYVWGKPVCSRCAGPIIQAGIQRIFALNPENEKNPEWLQLGKIAADMFRETGIEMVFYDPGKFSKSKKS